MRFVDTNILLYAVSADPRERTKADIARSILNSTDLALSVQVLQEFYVQSTRRSREGSLSQDQAVRLIDTFLRFPVQETSVDVLEAALAAAHALGSPSGTPRL
jgi:predicted nucleic acid-binding protein